MRSPYTLYNVITVQGASYRFLEVSNLSILQEIRDHLRRISSLEHPFELMILNFSRLLPYYRQGKFITAARNHIADHYAVQGKAIFGLPNLDVVMLYEQPERDQREQVFFHLRELFTHDPLMSMQTFGEVDGLFMQVFDLREQQDEAISELERLGKTITALETKQQTRKPAPRDHDSIENFLNPSDGTLGNTTVTDPEAEITRVAGLARKYQGLDIAPILRRELVIRHDTEAEEPLAFAFSLLDPAQRKLMTYRDQRVDADEALLNRYLGHVLQYRLLDFLTKTSDRKLRRNIAIPVHPELVLSRRFQHFTEGFSKGEYRRIILQFSLADLYNDYRLFHFAREHIQKMGFRLAISEVSYEVLETLDLEALGMDYLFLRADSDWAFLDEKKQAGLVQDIAEIGSERLVLTNCTQESSVTFARKHGIKLLCGERIRGAFMRSRAGQDFRGDNGAHSLTLGDSMQQRSR